MNTLSNRTPIVAAGLLIGLGILFLAINLLGIDFGRVWPIIFIVIAIGFYLPAILLPEARAALAALFIPGTIMLGLGLIFFYNTLTGDWESWAYAWSLIPAFVGLGMIFAARIGNWGQALVTVGLWLALIGGAIFGIMAMLFGSQAFSAIGPIVLIVLGVLMLFRSMQRS